MKRPTITDIARQAGVSKGAVSYALNGRPGVSEATRHRITEIARELGWSPSSTARALSGGRAGAIGLVAGRPDVLAVEPFLTALLEGVERELVLRVVRGPEAELAVYRRWRAERRVDGVLLAGPECAGELPGIGLPAVVLGGPPECREVPSVWMDDTAAADEVLRYLTALGHRRVVRLAGPAVLADPRVREEAFRTAAARLGLTEVRTVHTGPAPLPAAVTVHPPGGEVVRYPTVAAAAAGYRAEMATGFGRSGGMTGRNSGPAADAGSAGHRSSAGPAGRRGEPGAGFGRAGEVTGYRRGSVASAGHRAGRGAAAITAHPGEPAAPRLAPTVHSGHTTHAAETGAGVVRQLLTGPQPPTAVLCDTDTLAVAALVVARELGLAVPRDLSVVSWDDSDLCRLVRPALSAVRRPLAELGGLAASMLRDLIAGEDVGDVCASRPRLITRGSTGRARS
ncbi:LacI family DNA-binding transcriptional regulator [Amycolatopsis australiensis]|uniref:Sugar binding domain of LacI family protein n=1 Tax=Amycolatopsis australiensis TaxID=546364 RepID=A0A1K1S8T9_9PSEU|nr:LacI family DNA-binding transcriptional regulator [Amycolatopsis australiensis]SFW80801.1 sugar binding domain of LacI family protein [Amycolatopsis australiensis]